jgi:hypothetical protein
MRYTLRVGAGLLVLLQALVTQAFQTPTNYDFPITNKYAATVVGTPPNLVHKVPAEIPAVEHVIKGLHPVPEIFWYRAAGMRFSVALQDHPAPLIFNIAGTGAGFNSAKPNFLQKALYQAGFHVINISSPTAMSFVINASSSNLPGYAPDDAKDLYRAMQEAYNQVKGDIQVTGFHITGYSLGALDAAFVAKLDQQEKVFNIQKVYMINPPVDLNNSVMIIDKMLNDNIPGGITGVGNFLDEVFDDLGQVYKPNEGMNFDGDFIYKAYQAEKHRKRDDFEGKRAAALVGFSFRLSSSAIVFPADIMTKSNYIVPKDKVFTIHENLNYYARAANYVQFQDYINDMLIPGLQSKYPNKSKADFIKDSSLYAIEDFLKSNNNIHMVTNANEIILAPGEMDYMKSIMGNRLMVYPGGGHCGNINHKTNVNDMINFFKGETL